MKPERIQDPALCGLLVVVRKALLMICAEIEKRVDVRGTHANQ